MKNQSNVSLKSFITPSRASHLVRLPVKNSWQGLSGQPLKPPSLPSLALAGLAVITIYLSSYLPLNTLT